MYNIDISGKNDFEILNTIAPCEKENLSVEQDKDEYEIIIKCGLEEMAKAFFKDYEIIWHDHNVSSEENQQYMTQLERLCKVKAFTKWKEAEDYIKTAKTICHVITSGTNGELLVKEIFSSQNIPRIFAFCRGEQYQLKHNEKILCTEAKIEDVIAQIQKNLLEWHKQSSSLKFDLPAFAPIFDDYDKTQINHLHLYLKVIPNFKNRAEAKKDFVNLAKRIYAGQKSEKTIDIFDQTYNEYDMETILKWYTKPSFLHKVINNSLRIATSDSIQYCRFVLKDIERAIKDQYQKKSKDFSGLLYRGAYLSEEEWSSLKTNVNREIEMHGFLSVSKDQDIAWKFIAGDPKKIFITIIVPKGLNEEEQGFAEVEELSLVPKEKEILFNVRSRFTVLETEDEYSKDKPNRHLVLLYGAQGLRKYITERNPVHPIEIEDIGSVFCSRCQIRTSQMPGAFFFLSIINLPKQIYCCQECLESKATAPFLCFPITSKEYRAKVKGCLLTNSSQAKIPMYGYKCSKCGVKNQERYFVCTDCGENEKRWCDNCFGNTLSCNERKHAIILENCPFSFWSKKMPEKELNHLRFQNDLMTRSKLLYPQANMYFETHEYEKAIEFYNCLIVQNESNCKNQTLIHSFHGLGLTYFKQGELSKAFEYHLKSLDISKLVYGENHPVVADCYSSIGLIYSEQGQHMKGLEYYLKSLNIYESVCGENYPNVATSYSNIGLTHEKQGEHMKALIYYLKSLNIEKSVYGESHPEVAISYAKIGSIYGKQGRNIKGLEYHLKSLDILKTVYGENHPDIAALYSEIGRISNNQGEYIKALEYHLKSLNVYKSVYGENHPKVGDSYNNIGSTYGQQGEDIKALEYHLKSLNIFKSFFGENHPNVAASFQNLGLAYRQQGEYMKALEYYLKSLDISKSVYGEIHPEVAASYVNIGAIYIKQGDYTKALEYYLKSLNIDKSVYGENHPDVADCYSKIGSTYIEQGQHMKGLEYYLKSLNIYQSVYEENPPKVGDFYSAIGLIYGKQGQHIQGLDYCLKSLNIYKSVYGENHPKVGDSYYKIGLTYGQQGEYMKALEYYLKSLNICKSVYGENHPDVADCYNEIAMAYGEREEYMKTLIYFLKSLNVYKSVYGEDHPNVATCYYKIGFTYGQQGEHIKALESYSKSLNIYKSVYGENHSSVATSYHNIGSVYANQGKSLEALEYFQKSLSISKSLHGENHPETRKLYQQISKIAKMSTNKK